MGGWLELRLRSGYCKQPFALGMRGLPLLLKLRVTQCYEMTLDQPAMFRRELLFAVTVFVYALKAHVTVGILTRHPRGPLRLQEPMALPSGRVGCRALRIVAAFGFVASTRNTVA